MRFLNLLRVRKSDLTDSALEELLKIESLTEEEKYEDALKLVEELSQREGLTQNDQLAVRLLKSRIRAQTGKIDEARKLIEKIWPKVSKHKNPLMIMDYLIVKTHTSWVSGKLEEGMEAIGKSKELLEKPDSEYKGKMKERFQRRKCILLQHAGIINWYKGNLDKALECHLECLKLYEELGSKSGIQVHTII